LGQARFSFGEFPVKQVPAVFTCMTLKIARPYGIIYIALNVITGKAYVGQTKQTSRRCINAEQLLQRRKKNHKSDAKKRPNSCCPRFHNSIRKHGWEAFVWGILGTTTDQEALDALETHFIKLIRTVHPLGYNLKDGGNGRSSHNEESLLKISENSKRLWADPEWRKLQIEKQKMGWDPNSRLRASVSHLGVKMPPISSEHRANMSEAQRKRFANPVFHKQLCEAQKQRRVRERARKRELLDAQAKCERDAQLALQAG
jgi:group I intron endonuclease